jgi:cytochrome o ubiquinol oxidase operon protein cyoD
MSEFIPAQQAAEVAPGDLPEGDDESRVLGYVIGLVLAGGLTAVSFYITRGSLFWPPSIPTALIVLAIAQMGVHLVFFLHITSGPDSTNNVLPLAFGILIVFLIIAGSLWIMGNLDHNMLPMDQIMNMQR